MRSEYWYYTLFAELICCGLTIIARSALAAWFQAPFVEKLSAQRNASLGLG